MLLAINTASSETRLALLAGDFEDGNFGELEVLAETGWTTQNKEAELLLPEIDKMIQSLGREFSDISGVLVVKGPGSFTGVRIGVATANTIAHVNNLPLYSINTFEYWWQTREASDSLALLVYAGSRGVYVSLNALGAAAPQPIDLPDLNQFLIDHKITQVFGDITPAQIETITAAEFLQTRADFPAIIKKFAKIKPERLVEPLYIKPPGITQPKK